MNHYAELFFDVPDNHGDLEPDVLVYREVDHYAGTIQWRAEDAGGKEIYSRNTPNTPEWEERVQYDLLDLCGTNHIVRPLRVDGSDW